MQHLGGAGARDIQLGREVVTLRSGDRAIWPGIPFAGSKVLASKVWAV